jgi:hypothetical protein
MQFFITHGVYVLFFYVLGLDCCVLAIEFVLSLDGCIRFMKCCVDAC